MPMRFPSLEFGKILLASLVLMLVLATASRQPNAPGKVPPPADSSRLQRAMESFRIEPGLRIELIAAEPLVVDPVALAFDENRRMYVVENRGYPDPAEGGAPDTLGRIALLEDTDADGKYDRRHEFATGLTYPNGLLPWKGGVFVTCAPDIYYFKDTDNDGIADVRQVVLTGFSDSRTGQLRVSHPTLGLDGLVYVTCGLNNGKVHSPLHPERAAVEFSASDGRFDPETFEYEPTGGRSQFGLTFDAFGRRFGCSNRHPVLQVVLEPKYLRRNPHLLFNETTGHVSKVEAEAAVFPISGAITSADFIPKLMGLSHTGTFTSASGLLIFNGTGLTPSHRGDVFICESAQNLVQRQVVSQEGICFQSSLPYRDREFLSSTDEWFRPVFLQHGPEGSLYLADMHRKVIDHPSYVPEEARGSLDFESGKTDGRIYRIVREDFISPKEMYPFNSPVARVAALRSGEEWVRQTAHRLLLEQKVPPAIPLLQEAVLKAKLPESRLRALWTLHSYQALTVTILQKALADPSPGLREQGVLLAGEWVASHPELKSAIITASNDDVARVRFAGALVLGSLPSDAGVVSALAKIAARDGADRWARAAVLSGIGDRMPAFLDAFRRQGQPDSEAFSAVMQDLGLMFGHGASLAECRRLLTKTLASSGDYGWRVTTVLGIAEGVSRRAEGASKEPLRVVLGKNATATERQRLEEFLEKALSRAADEQLPIRQRTQATALLGYTNFEQSQRVVQDLLDTRNAPELQLEAVASLARLGDTRGAAFLTQKSIWSQYSPRVKSAVIGTLAARPAFTQVLLAAIAQGTVAAAEVPSANRQRLMSHKDQTIASRATELFRELEGGDRMQVYENYRSILTMKAEARAGKAVFERSCSACHTHAGKGGKVGPDLTGVRNQPADALLLHILVPNYEVYPAYQSVTVETKDGSTASGWLLAESDNALTLKTAFGTEESILRKNIKTLSNSGLSLMPDGLEQTMSKQEMAALIAFLKDVK